jgi:lysophospholipase L1-like esterase
MKAFLFQISVGIFAFTSLLGCSSGGGGNPVGSSGGSQAGATTATGGVSAGGTTAASTSAASSAGATNNGGTLQTGGQTQSPAGSVAQGGSAVAGSETGGSVAGGSATGGEVTTGGELTGGVATGGKSTNGGSTSASGGAATGGKTTAGGSISASGGEATGGKTTVGGSTSASGGATTGGKTTMGGTGSGGTTTGGTTAPPIGGSLGSSNGTTPIKVWMAGDSTMSGSGCDGGGWGSQFASVFNKNVTVVNSSVAGRSIQTWLYDPNVGAMGADGECTVNPKTYNPRWTAMTNPTTGMKPGDYLFIEFGINDATTTCETGKTRHVGSALFQTYLTTMAQAAKDMGAQPIFLTSMSGLQCSGSTAQPNRAFGPETKAAGAADNVPVIDATVLSAALYTSLGLCPSSGVTSGVSGAFFCNDTTHFEKAGALQIAQMVGKALKDQGIGLAAYLAN